MKRGKGEPFPSGNTRALVVTKRETPLILAESAPTVLPARAATCEGACRSAGTTRAPRRRGSTSPDCRGEDVAIDGVLPAVGRRPRRGRARTLEEGVEIVSPDVGPQPERRVRIRSISGAPADLVVLCRALLAIGLLALGGCSVHAGPAYPVGFYYAEPCPGGWCYSHPRTGAVVYVLPERRAYVGAVPVRQFPAVRAVPAPSRRSGYHDPQRPPHRPPAAPRRSREP